MAEGRWQLAVRSNEMFIKKLDWVCWGEIRGNSMWNSKDQLKKTIAGILKTKVYKQLIIINKQLKGLFTANRPLLTV